MSMIQIAGPLLEPVSLAEAQAHLRIEGADEDILLQSLITSARLHVETLTGRALVLQSWRLVRDAWPRGQVVEIPIAPVQAVTQVRVFTDEDIAATLDPSRYLVETVGMPARLAMRGRQGWPHPGRAIGGIEIDLVAGYGPAAADVPQSLRLAILQLVAHWYQAREPVSLGAGALPVPGTVDALINPYRPARL